jgi:hypothetical protein
MKSLNNTLKTEPGQQFEISNESLPLKNPTNILQQQKSDIITNPYIKPQLIQEPENKTFGEINTNMSVSFMDFLDDLFVKPDNVSWFEYLPLIIKKDKRYHYFAVLLFLIALYIILIK